MPAPWSGRGRTTRCGSGLQNTHREFRSSFVSRNTSVTFGYVGGSTITNSTGANELVGNFTITEPCSSIPLLPAGSSIATTYSCYQIKNSCGNSVPILFSVVPEPSSLVVVALVGSSLL